jgi:hypothetical protein
MTAVNIPNGKKPKWIEILEDAFGCPSQAAFGTAVFHELISDETASAESGTLEQRAFKWYQHFCGETWEKFGAENWMREWKLVYRRSSKAQSILNELDSVDDPQVRMNAETMLEGTAEPQSARAALKQAFDDPSIEDLRIFRMGDGGAMSGIMIAGRRANNETAFVGFLLD